MTIANSIGGLIAKGKTPVSNTDTALQIWGLWHFLIPSSDTTVSVQIIGQDCGDFTVGTDGSVVVPLYGATIAGGAAGGVDAIGVVKLADLQADTGLYDLQQATPVQMTISSVVTYLNVPIVIGRGFVMRGQRLRAASAEDIRSSTGAALGKIRRTHQFAALVVDAVKVQFGTTFAPSPLGNMDYNIMLAPGVVYDGSPLAPSGVGFSGVYRNTLVADGDYDDMLCWQVDRPFPFTLTAVSSFLVGEDRLSEGA